MKVTDKSDTVEIAIRLINGVGFPIVVSMALFWFNIESLDNQTQLLNKFNTTMQNNNQLLNEVSKTGIEQGQLANIIINELNELKRKCSP